MKKGIVIANLITLKRGGYLHKGKKVTSNDIDNFDECVKGGKIKLDEPIKETPKQEPKKSDNKSKK
jgi:hypothetical protein